MERRRFLQSVAGSLMALAAPQVAPAPRKAKSVIWLWMDGGMSQADTWDSVSSRLPRCAAQMRHLSIVRTVSHEVEEPALATSLMHCGIYPNCNGVDPSFGTILSHELAPRPLSAPPFVSIGVPDIPDVDLFGEEFRPLPLEAVLLAPPGTRKRALLEAQDAAWTAPRPQKGVEQLGKQRERAAALRGSGFAEALELEREPERIRAAYGEGFGRRCLLARRLTAAGTAVVEVGLPGWNEPGKTAALCGELDRGLGTLIEDLASQGRLEETVVICCTPFGRSADGKPKPRGFSVVLAGGTLVGGRVYDKKPVPLWDLFATLLIACGVNPNRSYATEARKVKYVSKNGSVATSGNPIAELF